MQLLEHFNELSLHPKNAKELKGLILQLAVEGKLTENWRIENPEITIEQKEIAKQFSMTTSELLKHSNSINEIEVPSSWIKVNFSIVFDIKGGSQPPKSMFIQEPKKGYVQLFQIRDFGKNPQPVYVPIDSVSKLCTEEDIMIGRYGASIGKIFYGQNGAYNVALVRLIWNREILIQDFVYQLFSARKIQEFFQNCSRSAQAGFNKTDLEELNITLPPLEEQKAIVEVVNKLFAEVDQLETLTKERIHLKEDFVTSALKLLSTGYTSTEWAFLKEHFSTFFTEKSNIKKLRESILQLAVQGKLTRDWRRLNPDVENAKVLLERIKKEKEQLVKEKKIKKENPLPKISDEEIPYELPEGWVWEYLGSSILKLTDGTHHSPANIEQGKYKYVTAKNIKNNGIKLSNITYVTDEDHQEIYSRCNPEFGDILYIKDGATTGICCINNLEEEFSMLSSVALIKQSSNIVGDYLLSLFRSPYYYDLMRSGMTGVAITRVTLSKLKASIIPIPPLKEQQAIVDKVNSLMALCDELEEAIEISKTTQEKWMESSLREVFEPK
jgi:type I restriction enzyme S subunit